MADASCEPRVDAELPGALWERLAAAVDGLAGEVAADRERAPLLLAELLA